MPSDHPETPPAATARAGTSRADLPATIRPATPTDLDQMVDLLWTVAAEGRWLGTEVPFDRDARRAGMAERMAGSDSAVLVADAGRTTGVVGQISVVVARYGVADLGMMLDPDWRGRGLGGALLDAAVSWSAAAGAHKMALEVWPDNTAGRALYRSRGFVEEGRLVRHYRRQDGARWDAVIMGRALDDPAPDGPSSRTAPGPKQT